MSQDTTSKIVCTSGYYSPAHVGHLECLEMSKRLAGPGGKLIVIVNSGHQEILKKGKEFMPEKERLALIKAFRCVDDAFIAIDQDKSVCESIRHAHKVYGVEVFTKGGDRFSNEVPEAKVCNDLNITIIDGLGAKIQSSSALTGLKEIKQTE